MKSKKLLSNAMPLIPIRALHLDLKGVPPKAERLIGLLKVIKLAGYNALLVEWEDTFPWSVDKGFRSETAYTKAQLQKFFNAAKLEGIEIIPLVQCLGHMETPLYQNKYKHLREIPCRSDVLNPLAKGARELVEKMVDDVLSISPKPRWFHLGGDEAWSFGSHPATKDFISRHGKGALYLHHVEPILDKLIKMGIRPILWHDMMRDWDKPALKRLSQKADLCVWEYQGHPLDENYLVSKEILNKFRKSRINMWAGTAYKGADGHDSDLPDVLKRGENVKGWAEVAVKYGMKGAIATAWSRFSTHDVQCEPIDGALDSLVYAGVILHDGKPPSDGVEACIRAIGVGEKQRFEVCKVALQKLADTRKQARLSAVLLRETVVMAGIDSRRRNSGLMIKRLDDLRNKVRDLDEAAILVKKAFKGLIDTIWCDRYIAERVIPAKEELKELDGRVKALDNDGYKSLCLT